jgi:hypothetical protein
VSFGAKSSASLPGRHQAPDKAAPREEPTMTAGMQREFCEALTNPGRSAEIPEESDVYGWLIGSWELEVHRHDSEQAGNPSLCRAISLKAHAGNT